MQHHATNLQKCPPCRDPSAVNPPYARLAKSPLRPTGEVSPLPSWADSGVHHRAFARGRRNRAGDRHQRVGLPDLHPARAARPLHRSSDPDLQLGLPSTGGLSGPRSRWYSGSPDSAALHERPRRLLAEQVPESIDRVTIPSELGEASCRNRLRSSRKLSSLFN